MEPDRCPELSDLVVQSAPLLAGATACRGDLRADTMRVGPRGAVFVDRLGVRRGQR